MLERMIFLGFAFASITTAISRIEPRSPVKQNDCRALIPAPNGCFPDLNNGACLYPKGTPGDDTCGPVILEEENSAVNYSCQRTSVFKEGVDWLSAYPHDVSTPPQLTTSKTACYNAISDMCWNLTQGPIYEQWAIVSDTNPPNPPTCTLGYFLPKGSGHGSYLKCFYRTMNILTINCIHSNYQNATLPSIPPRDHGTINVKDQEYPWLVDPLEPAFFVSSKGEADITIFAPNIPKNMFSDGILWAGYPPKERAHV
ncbi:MAG: hypothetical protein M1812_006118 [Candelaria pacifica]|nr:MAG: hypothetical protein M1812_006118 [Candelaria pacifica]